jgi:hypothetical protein
MAINLILVSLTWHDFSADLIIEQLDRDGSTLKTVNLRGCFPTALSAIELNYGSTDAIEEFHVNGKYNTGNQIQLAKI